MKVILKITRVIQLHEKELCNKWTCPYPPPGVQFASEEGYELGAHIIEATEGESLSGFFKQGESFPEI